MGGVSRLSTGARAIGSTTMQRHGHVVVGGSPLKLFRLTDGGARSSTGSQGGDGGRLVLVDAPCSTPARSTRDPDSSPPVHGGRRHDRRAVAGPPRTLSRGAVLVDDGSDPRSTAPTVRLDQQRARGRPQRRARPGHHRSSRSSTPTSRLPDGGSTASAHFDDERVALVAPRVRLGRRRPRWQRTRPQQPARPRWSPARVRPVPASATSRPPRSCAAPRRSGRSAASTRHSGSARTSTSCGGSTSRSGSPVRAERRRGAPTRAELASWVRQRIGYGSSAAPLSRRHPGALAPIRMSGWSLTPGHWRPIGGPCGRRRRRRFGRGTGSQARRPPARRRVRPGLAGNLHAGEQLAAAVRSVVAAPRVAAVRSRPPAAVLVGLRRVARRRLRSACVRRPSPYSRAGSWQRHDRRPSAPLDTA